MQNCKKCNQSFPDRMIIDGKERFLKSRSYCLDCSPFMSKKGYLIRKDNTSKKHKSKTTKECPICDKEFKKNKNNVCPTCRAEYRRYKNKQRLIEDLGGYCQECQESNIACLDFHHRDPTEKSFVISCSLHLSFDKLKTEAKKCDLLCSNCHRKHHYNCKQKLLDYYQSE